MKRVLETPHAPLELLNHGREEGGGRGWDDTAAASVSGGAPRGTADAFRHVGLLAGVG